MDEVNFLGEKMNYLNTLFGLISFFLEVWLVLAIVSIDHRQSQNPDIEQF